MCLLKVKQMSWADTVLYNLFLLHITNLVNLYTHRWLHRTAPEVSKFSSGFIFQDTIVPQCSSNKDTGFLIGNLDNKFRLSKT